ncbi:MAG: tetratricopeptide repeat protein [Bryobacteraceae bacterium]
MKQFLAALALILSSLAPIQAATHLVLPFFNLTQSNNLDWIGESISESIREALASEGVLVVERHDREEVYRRLAFRPYALLTRASVVEIAQALDADQVIYGQFELIPPANGQTNTRGSLRISAHTIDVRRIRKGPEYAETGSLEDLAALQSHIAWQALQFAVPKGAPSEEQFRRRRPPVRVDAIENYIRGLLSTIPAQRHRFFTQSARLDPNYPPPCFELGRMLFESKDYAAAAEWLKKVPESAPGFREATFLLGLALYNRNDFPAAQAAFQLVAATVPLNEVLNNLGAAQSRRNAPESVENLERALEGDPSDPDYHFNVGYALWKQGKFDQAADRFRAVLERTPDDEEATIFLGRCLKKAGPRPNDPRSEGRERLKLAYQESAWWQLKAMFEKK